MTARRDGSRGGGAIRGRDGEMMVPIGELRDGDRVGFKLTPYPTKIPNGATEWLTIKKVWRYNDGSVLLEFKGRNPGMWKYDGDDLLQMIEVKRRWHDGQ